MMVRSRTHFRARLLSNPSLGLLLVAMLASFAAAVLGAVGVSVAAAHGVEDPPQLI